MMSMLEVERLTRDYGGGKGVFDLSFRVGEGEVFGFLGPKAAGKTPPIRHLMGFIRPKAGACRIDGMDCWRQRGCTPAPAGCSPALPRRGPVRRWLRRCGSGRGGGRF